MSAAAQEQPPRSVVPERLLAPGTLGRLRVSSVELFAERGYHGVSVRDIVASVGVNPSSLYAHYRSKEQLFSELVLAAHEELRDRQRTALLTAPPHPVDQLCAIVRAHVLFHTEYPLLATIGDNDLNVLTGASLEQVTSVRKEAIDLLKAVLEHGQQTGAFHCPEPWLAIAAIAGIGIRVAVWYRAVDHQPSPAEGYAARVRTWMPQYTADHIADTFAHYALSIVGAAPESGETSGVTNDR